jgi:hypothetical protein
MSAGKTAADVSKACIFKNVSVRTSGLSLICIPVYLTF